MDQKQFFSDPDPTFQEILDPDPILDTTQFLSKEAKDKLLNKTAEQILILKKTFLKHRYLGNFLGPFTKTDSNQWVGTYSADFMLF